jgi:hypothetical protein
VQVANVPIQNSSQPVISLSQWDRVSYIYETYGNVAMGSVAAEATQLAIWNSLYGAGYVVGGGAGGAVDSLLTTIQADHGTDTSHQSYYLARTPDDGYGGQALDGALVPEGNSLALLLGGLAPFGLFSLARRRNAARVRRCTDYQAH